MSREFGYRATKLKLNVQMANDLDQFLKHT